VRSPRALMAGALCWWGIGNGPEKGKRVCNGICNSSWDTVCRGRGAMMGWREAAGMSQVQVPDKKFPLSPNFGGISGTRSYHGYRLQTTTYSLSLPYRLPRRGGWWASAPPRKLPPPFIPTGNIGHARTTREGGRRRRKFPWAFVYLFHAMHIVAPFGHLLCSWTRAV
jgi:hypothetical protein